MLYECKHCKRIVQRRLDQPWVKSYCSKFDITVHLQKVPLGKYTTKYVLQRMNGFPTGEDE